MSFWTVIMFLHFIIPTNLIELFRSLILHIFCSVPGKSQCPMLKAYNDVYTCIPLKHQSLRERHRSRKRNGREREGLQNAPRKVNVGILFAEICKTRWELKRVCVRVDLQNVRPGMFKLAFWIFDRNKNKNKVITAATYTKQKENRIVRYNILRAKMALLAARIKG